MWSVLERISISRVKEVIYKVTIMHLSARKHAVNHPGAHFILIYWILSWVYICAWWDFGCCKLKKRCILCLLPLIAARTCVIFCLNLNCFRSCVHSPPRLLTSPFLTVPAGSRSFLWQNPLAWKWNFVKFQFLYFQRFKFGEKKNHNVNALRSARILLLC